MSLEPDHYIEDLTPGLSASRTNVITAQDIEAFAQVSGDTNPVHLDHDYAAQTMFGERIAHGMLNAAFISAALGTQMPGRGAIYLGQTLKFKAPVKIGDVVVTTVTVKDVIIAKKRATIQTICKVGDKVVTEGEAMIMLPARS